MYGFRLYLLGRGVGVIDFGQMFIKRDPERIECLSYKAFSKIEGFFSTFFLVPKHLFQLLGKSRSHSSTSYDPFLVLP